jgi:hypothetical protein
MGWDSEYNGSETWALLISMIRTRGFKMVWPWNIEPTTISPPPYILSLRVMVQNVMVIKHWPPVGFLWLEGVQNMTAKYQTSSPIHLKVGIQDKVWLWDSDPCWFLWLGGDSKYYGHGINIEPPPSYILMVGILNIVVARYWSLLVSMVRRRGFEIF